MTPNCKNCNTEANWHSAYSEQGIPFGRYWCSICNCEVAQNVLIDGAWVEIVSYE